MPKLCIRCSVAVRPRCSEPPVGLRVPAAYRSNVAPRWAHPKLSIMGHLPSLASLPLLSFSSPWQSSQQITSDQWQIWRISAGAKPSI